MAPSPPSSASSSATASAIATSNGAPRSTSRPSVSSPPASKSQERRRGRNDERQDNGARTSRIPGHLRGVSLSRRRRRDDGISQPAVRARGPIGGGPLGLRGGLLR